MIKSPKEKALAWRSLEILIARELAKRQKDLFGEMALSEEELKEQEDSSLNSAAELFLAREFKLPYYYGIDKISRLASLNIQQFLGLAGDVFEESLALELLKKQTSSLTPDRQHALMKKIARGVWDEIPRKVRHGRKIQNFIQNIGRFAHWYTYRPTAPNDPGVTGTAIKMHEREKLSSLDPKGGNSNLNHMADILASALAHNLLVTQLDYKCKGERWMLLNLNRILCVHFDLPLGYGLYKERPLSTLCDWVEQSYTPPPNEEALL